MYSSIPITKDDIHEAFAILHSFIEVTKNRGDLEDRMEALMLHCQDLNVTDELYAYIVAYCCRQFGEEKAPTAVVGALIGLRIADCATLRSE